MAAKYAEKYFKEHFSAVEEFSFHFKETKGK